ncbi:EF-hand domain-containing protein [Aggregatimonas sangjinii]|uniref:EF-hand domain-containing protein n=1 Tax=Aggregatimonas sangjinii TaxID=2583587 RepID=A0A5B7SP14_9FLAO|nr:EF-hand domain-containing protein [Aggregatimonas sangjinii]QCX00375.1 EF-hand domain-containing protein [Aggregatimonas sangjinii]
MNTNTFRTTIIVFGLTLFFSNISFAQSQNKEGRKKPPTFNELIKEMDANEDGKLSKDELKGPLKENFSKVDTDEDGFITKEEFDKAPRPKRGPKKR